VAGTGKGLIGHAGAVLLRKCADQTGLTCGLSETLGTVLARVGRSVGWDRGVVLVQLAVAIALGATSMRQIALLAHHADLFGDPPSDSTVRRVLEETSDPAVMARLARARAKVRAHVWTLLEATAAGFPWLAVAGKLLTGWIVIDIDATLITAHSAKQGAAATFKKGFGFHPLAAWCANTAENLAMLLRPGNAGSNDVADHLAVLAEAIRQIPAHRRAKLLIRVDGAGATHDLVDHLKGLNTVRRTVRFTVGWTITDVDEDAIAALPGDAWETAVAQDGEAIDDEHAGVAELTGLNPRAAAWGRPADRAASAAVPAAQGQAHRFRETHRVEVLHHLHQHRLPRHAPGSRLRPRPIHRRAAPRPRRGRGPGPHRQGHGTAQPALQDLDRQLRMGPDLCSGRRPGCLDPAARPARRPRPRPRRARHHAVLPVAPARPPRQPCPNPHTEDQFNLALEERIPDLLAAPVRTAHPHMTSANSTSNPRKEYPAARGTAAPPSASGRPATTPH
jgi:Transposase DDE domain group 1